VALVSHSSLWRGSVGACAGYSISFVGASIIAFGDLGTGTENLIGDALSLIGAIALGSISRGRRLGRG